MSEGISPFFHNAFAIMVYQGFGGISVLRGAGRGGRDVGGMSGFIITVSQIPSVVQ